METGQGIGDIFSARIAGNFVNTDILGSLEFACKLAGSKLILVLGHTSCGAIKGACDNAKLGNLTSMLENFSEALSAVETPQDPSSRNSSNTEFVNQVCEKNVELTINKILSDSPILNEMNSNGEINIVGGIYDVSTGKVRYID
jgi:carbonic anhydrase